MQRAELNKVAVITGATGGIGAAIARTLSSAGYALVLNAPSSEKLCALRAQLAGPCVALAGNLRAESMPRELLDAAIAEFGSCDICFNNSGLLEAGSIETLDIERVCNMVRVNVEGSFRMAYTFLQHFVAQGRGHLVNTSFALSQRVQPAVGAYAATKYAVEALSEALRVELGRTDVRVSCVEPGTVRTSLRGQWKETHVESVDAHDPFEPEALARMVLFMLEPPVQAAARQLHAVAPFQSESLFVESVSGVAR
jgi:NADP-dependent 3-hydroxy acid dehydrogenase YdfG